MSLSVCSLVEEFMVYAKQTNISIDLATGSENNSVISNYKSSERLRNNIKKIDSNP